PCPSRGEYPAIRISSSPGRASRMARLLLCCLVLAVLSGCFDSERKREANPESVPGPSEPGAAGFEERLLEVARTYERYNLPEREVRVAQKLCDGRGLEQTAAPARLSKSPDPRTHRRKLYWLF